LPLASFQGKRDDKMKKERCCIMPIQSNSLNCCCDFKVLLVSRIGGHYSLTGPALLWRDLA
ncbi:MAG: hypothetical protein WCC67_03800, partial [Candidatus Acidiferrales bacterium]